MPLGLRNTGQRGRDLTGTSGNRYNAFLYPSFFLGHVNFTISTKILDSNELCGGKRGFVPAKGRSDTLIKPVLVKVSFLQA